MHRNPHGSPAPALALTVVLMLGTLSSGCSSDQEPILLLPARQAVVTDAGATITLAADSPQHQLLKSVEVHTGTVRATVLAPARVVASVSRGYSPGGGPILIFDSPELTSLYSAFIQNITAYEKAQQTIARTQDLFEHQAATGKDVSDARTDLANARTAMAETEGRIRAMGFNPQEFRTARPGIVWLLSDVPETQLYEVRHGELTAIEFASFAGQKFTGRVAAIGDVIDNATRTVKVRIAVPNPNERLRPGMFAQVNFGQGERNAIMIPQSSVATVLGKHYVFVKTDAHNYMRRQVELGQQIDDNIIVVNGLNEGEQIAIEGVMLLKGLSFGY